MVCYHYIDLYALLVPAILRCPLVVLDDSYHWSHDLTCKCSSDMTETVSVCLYTRILLQSQVKALIFPSCWAYYKVIKCRSISAWTWEKGVINLISWVSLMSQSLPMLKYTTLVISMPLFRVYWLLDIHLIHIWSIFCFVFRKRMIWIGQILKEWLGRMILRLMA